MGDVAVPNPLRRTGERAITVYGTTNFKRVLDPDDATGRILRRILKVSGVLENPWHVAR